MTGGTAMQIDRCAAVVVFALPGLDLAPVGTPIYAIDGVAGVSPELIRALAVLFVLLVTAPPLDARAHPGTGVAETAQAAAAQDTRHLHHQMSAPGEAPLPSGHGGDCCTSAAGCGGGGALPSPASLLRPVESTAPAFAAPLSAMSGVDPPGRDRPPRTV